MYNEHIGGYFVKYKDKGSDYFSENYIDAKRYKSITAAFTRLGFDLTLSGINDMLKKFDTNHIQMQKKLNRIVDEENKINYDSVIPFEKGRIDILKINGNNITYLGEIDKLVLYNLLSDHKNIFEHKFKRINKSTDPDWY